MTKQEIEKRREDLRKQLDELAPDIFFQYERLSEMLSHIGDDPEQELTWLKQQNDHGKAIEWALLDNQGPMTRRQIVDRLQSGHYIPSGSAKYWALNTALGHYLPTKTNRDKERNARRKWRFFIISGEEGGIDEMLIGLVGRDESKNPSK